MKLNVGCGFNKLKDYINVDKDDLCVPDLLFDCEKVWPLDDSSVSEMILFHTLEHLGETTEKFLFLISEMYRVSQHNCVWKITVPHYNSDIFHIDPTHVRKIAPTTLRMFDQKFNFDDLNSGGHHTKLGLMCNVDIEVVKEFFYLSEPWNSLAHSPENIESINFAGRHYTNVGSDIYIECKIHKPQRYKDFYYAR
jgi:predicted SAM-dependent methyltransferase